MDAGPRHEAAPVKPVPGEPGTYGMRAGGGVFPAGIHALP